MTGPSALSADAPRGEHSDSMTSPAVTHRPRTAVIAEALGYAGGALVLVGVVLVAARTWESLGPVGRVAVTGVTGVVAGVAAWRTPDDGVGFGARQRLRGTLWLVATLALAVAAGVAVHDMLGAHSPQAVVLGSALVAVAVSASVWRGDGRPIQMATTLVGAGVAAGSAGAHVSAPGVAAIGAGLVGAVVLVVGLREVLRPSTVAVWCGGFTLLLACQMLGGQWQSAGLLVSVAVAAAMVGLAQWPTPVHRQHHVVALAVTGGVLLFSALPGAIGYHAEQAGVLTGAVVWVASLGLIWAATPRHQLRAPIPVWLLAAVLFVVGPVVVSTQWRTPGVVAGATVAMAAVAVGVGTASVPLTLLGAFGILVSVPRAVIVVVPGELAAPVAIVVAGLVVVLVAVWLLRRRSVTPADSEASTPSSRAPEGAG